MDMSPRALELLRHYIHSACGLALSEDKEYLITSRLEPLATARGCKTFEEFVHLLNTAGSSDLRHDVICAITTNETSFFRDGHPWDAIKNEVIPHLLENWWKDKRPATPIRIWSAAASTGQEAYSLAILLNEYMKENSEKKITPELFEIHATDISINMISKAREGVYSRYEVKRGLSEEHCEEYFEPEGDRFRINKRLRKMVRFYDNNLLNPKMEAEEFDLILCRNVLIYFDLEVKGHIFRQVHSMLRPDGWLLLGSTENTYGLTDKFTSQRSGNTILYRKR